jgi:hypothetical protein
MSKFENGVSGNPRGRPRLADIQRRQTPNAKLRSLLKKLEKNLPDAVDKMVALMQDSATPATVQMSAAKTILSEYKEIYQMLEAPAKEKVDGEDSDENTPAPIVDFTNIVSIKDN